MSQIPEGATHVSAGHYYKKEGPSWMLYGSASQWMETACLWKWLDENAEPLIPEWTGEGLPPAGTVCEWHPNQDGWVQVEILGHNGEETWFRRAGESISETCLRMAFFRPIRTPEQIAAEERDKTIEDMRKQIGFEKPFLGPCPVAALYDLGYRKFEIVDN